MALRNGLIEKFRGKAGFFSTKKDRWEYRWNQNGMLEGVRSPHRYGPWTRFTYDALGRRLRKLGDATFHYLWNGNVPLHEWRTGERYEDGSLKSYSEDLKTWLFEEESFVPLALIQDGKAYSIVCDQLGTPTEAYDEEGREVWYRRLDMNGKVLEETQPGLNPEGYVSIPFPFQGQYYDYETGLACNRFRYYDPELGRYISQDPIGLVGGIAMHAYVNSSLLEVDLFGLSASSYNKLEGPLHYIATNKNTKRGRKWTNRFKPFFDKAQLDIDGPDNKVYVPNHKGPHPDEYHEYVYNKLKRATKGIDPKKSQEQYQMAVKSTLKEIASEAQEVGSQVNKWLTKT